MTRILIAGNLAGHAKYHVKKLREKGIEADLLEYDTTKPNWKFDIIRTMRKYDLIHASTELPIFAMLSGKPYVVATTGSDISELAFKNTIKGRLLQMAYHKAKKIIILAPYLMEYAEKLKLNNIVFIPILSDLDFFKPIDYKKESSFKVFHPTSHIWNVKGNDILINGFIKAWQYNHSFRLLVIKRGTDFEGSLYLLKENQVNFNILESQNKESLKGYYQNSDVIADQFISGSTGLIGQEAMACGKPLIQYCNFELYDKFYDERPPIISCKTSDEITKSLIELNDNSNMVKEIGIKSRRWIEKYHGEKAVERYIDLYQSIR